MHSTTLRELLFAFADISPSAACMLAPGYPELTYGMLRELVEHAGDVLAGAGVGPQEVIAAALPDGPVAAAAFLGLSANCAYAPLNMNDTSATLEALLRRMAPAAIVLSAGSAGPAREAAVRLGLPEIEVGIDFRFHWRGPHLSHTVRHTPPEETDVALLMPTSGTTSLPKLVMHTHRSMLTGGRLLAQAFQLTSSDRTILTSPCFHAMSLVGGIIVSIARGGSFIAPAVFDPAGFFRNMERYRPTWFSAVPTQMETLQAAASEFQHIIDRNPVRFFRSVAAPLHPSLAARLEQVFHAPLIQVYGMTEVPPIACEPLPPGQRKPGSVGLPAGPEIAVLDDSGDRVPVGDVGRVVVRGANVAAGYWNDSESTAAAFQDGWFHTGDLGHFDSEGYLFLTGRLKDVINRGGEKISPQEIDDVFNAHPDVTLALTFPLPHKTLGEEIAVAIVPRVDSAVTILQLQRYAAGRLAFTKIPRRFYFLDRIPLGATGKHDRAAVRELCQQMPVPPHPGPTHTQPGTAIEEQLATIWRKVLGIERVGVHDNFFDLGGDSLAATGLLAAISEKFDCGKLPMGGLMVSPTIAQMAALLSKAASRQTQLDPDIIPLQPDGSRIPFFFVGAGVGSLHVTQALGPDQPVFSVAVPQLTTSPPHTMADYAWHCVQALKRFHSKGPYLLGGFCANGVIAMEMARQLERDGANVPLVIVFDVHMVIATETLGAKLRYHLQRLRGMSPGAASIYAAGRIRTIVSRWNASLWQIPCGICGALGRPLPGWLQNHGRSLSIALRNYRQAYHPRTIVHIVADDRIKPVRGGVELNCARTIVCKTPGDHGAVFRPPHAAALARWIRLYIQEAQKSAEAQLDPLEQRIARR